MDNFKPYVKTHLENIDLGIIRVHRVDLNFEGAPKFLLEQTLEKTGAVVMAVGFDQECQPPYDSEFPDGYFVGFKEDNSTHWLHCRWEGPPYARATHEFIDDMHIPHSCLAADLRIGEHVQIGAYPVRFISQVPHDTVLFIDARERGFWPRAIYHILVDRTERLWIKLKTFTKNSIYRL